MQTKLIRSFYNITPKHQGGVVTIGNFDGVHRAHQALLALTIEKAKMLKVPSIVVTFEPHAFEFFAGEKVSVPRLTRLREKFCALSESGVDYVLVLPFNQRLASLSAAQFVTQILHGALRVKHMIVGDDFRFGHQRQGDFSLLQSMGQNLGFSVEIMPAVMMGGLRISSTAVRKALAEGDHVLANQLLGRPYSMKGCVRRGDQRGREWGFPTINLFLHRKLTPVKGVYTVLVYGADAASPNKVYQGAANVGVRPNVDGTKALLEVHLLDFNQDIYGRYVTVEFCEKLREEKRFPSLDLLKEQIAKDVEDTRHYFQKKGVL